MKLARTAPALLLLALAIVMGGSFGCDSITTLLAPAVPTLIDKATAPQIKAPEGPQLPDAPEVPELPDPPEHRNCCFRDRAGVAKSCENKERCCTGTYSRGDCEDAGGYWFDTAAGCAGAC